MNRLIKLISPKCLVLAGFVGLTGCVDLNDPYSPGYGKSYDSGYYDDRHDSDWNDRRERREIERERERLDRERDRLREEREREREHERNRREQERRYQPPPPERCPSGFSPSEQKCSNEERRRGCKDMRLPGGLGCVRR